MLRVGIDVGGTFTDLAAIDGETGEIVTLKVPSTPRDPSRGVLTALERFLTYGTHEASSIEFLGHSTTIATNALLGQLGLELPRVAMVTTHGFRDVIEIGRQNRSEVYDLFVQRPRPLVARDDRFTVRERIDYRGEILEPLDEYSLADVCAALRTRGNVAAVAVCLLNAYANDRHERDVAGAIAAAMPHAVVVRSSQVDPEYREYERFSTTVVNAALAPIVASYLDRLSRALYERGLPRAFYVMRSDGGLATAEHAALLPAAIVESGPASGVVAAAALSERTGVHHLLSFDMGGTTAKAGAIVDGLAQVVTEFEVAGKTHSGRSVRGSGYPVRFPFVDLAEVSAGGGTIAWLDDASSLRVGPMSAGADPGPACYGTSGRATVTDANVVLGRLNQTHLLGGAFPIDAQRARSAVAAIAAPLGLSVEEAAAGIVTVIDAQMSKVLRIVTIERGLDPRDFTLAAFGGGGPLHACALAGELGITRVLVPQRPGIFSAFGLLVADVREHAVIPVLRTLDETDFAGLEKAFLAHESQGRTALLEQGALPESIRCRRELDARYAGQSFELTVGHDASPATVGARFHHTHRARYGYDVPEECIELVNARLTVSGKLRSAAPGVLPIEREPRDAMPASAQRRVWCDGGFAAVPVFQRDRLSDGDAIAGPAVVEQYDTCTYLAPRWWMTVRGDLLVLDREASAS
jgi:N-methylhydantoinase A